MGLLASPSSSPGRPWPHSYPKIYGQKKQVTGYFSLGGSYQMYGLVHVSPMGA